MKKLLLASLVMAGMAATAQAQVDFSSKSIDIAITAAEINAVSGISGGSTPYAIAFAADGDLVVVCDPGGSDGNIIKINPTTKAGSIVRTESQMLSDIGTSETDFDYDDVVIADGALYFADHQAVNQVIKLPLASPVASTFYVEEGLNAFDAISGTQFVATVLDAFGGDADDVGSLDAAGNFTSQLTSIGGPQTIAIFSNGDVAVWSEQYRTGDDTLKRIAGFGSANTVTDITPTEWTNGGITDMVIDSSDNIIAWNEFDADGEFFDVYDGTTVHSFPSSEVMAVTGLSDLSVQIGGMALREPDANTREVFLADKFNSGAIIRITYGSASVKDWTKY